MKRQDPSYTGEIRNFINYYDKTKMSEKNPRRQEYGIDKLRIIKTLKDEEKKYVLKAFAVTSIAIVPAAIAYHFVPDTPVYMATGVALIPAFIYSVRNAFLADKKSIEAQKIIDQNQETFNIMNDRVHALNSLDDNSQENKRLSGKTFTKKFHR